MISNKKETAVAVFLDMEKAFDRVWHAGLLYKLANSSTPRPVFDVIASFLEGRRFKALVEGKLSSERPILAGVPQGSCLSPTCYSLYTDDIPAEDGVILALYADDAAYITASRSRDFTATKMQRALNALPEWLSKWRLSVNVAKTQAFCTTNKHMLPQCLTLQGQTINWTRTAKYLGVTIDRKLTMAHHSRTVIASVAVARNLLRPVLTSSLPLRLKVGIYKTYIRPRLTYAAPAWYGLLAETHRKRLRSQQSSVLRLVADAPRYVRNTTIQRDLRIESLDEFIARLAKTLFARTDVSEFAHVRELAPTYERGPRTKAYPRELVVDQEEDLPDPNPKPRHRRTRDAHLADPQGAAPGAIPHD